MKLININNINLILIFYANDFVKYLTLIFPVFLPALIRIIIMCWCNSGIKSTKYSVYYGDNSN